MIELNTLRIDRTQRWPRTALVLSMGSALVLLGACLNLPDDKSTTNGSGGAASGGAHSIESGGKATLGGNSSGGNPGTGGKLSLGGSDDGLGGAGSKSEAGSSNGGGAGGDLGRNGGASSSGGAPGSGGKPASGGAPMASGGAPMTSGGAPMTSGGTGAQGGTPASGWADWHMPNWPGQINPTSYTDLGDGTIKDNVTGLIWEKKLGVATPGLYTDAVKYCDMLNLGGHDDWRLPTRIEMISLWVPTCTDGLACIDRTAFPNSPQSVWYWTSTVFQQDPTANVITSANECVTYFSSRGSAPGYTALVRCVR